MKVTELNKDQLTELKQRYYDSDKRYNKEKVGVSYGELLNINDIISDDEIFKVYEGYKFTNDDFFCTTGKESVKELQGRARAHIEGALQDFSDISCADIPESDDMLNLSYFANRLEQVVEDLRKYIKEYEDAVKEGV